MVNETEHRRKQREEMVKHAFEFAKQQGRNPTEREVRKEVEAICDKVEARRDRNIKDER